RWVGACEDRFGVGGGVDEEIVVALEDQERHADAVEVARLEEARRRCEGDRGLEARLAQVLVVGGDEGREGAARVPGERDAPGVDAAREAVAPVAREAEQAV